MSLNLCYWAELCWENVFSDVAIKDCSVVCCLTTSYMFYVLLYLNIFLLQNTKMDARVYSGLGLPPKSGLTVSRPKHLLIG